MCMHVCVCETSVKILFFQPEPYGNMPICSVRWYKASHVILGSNSHSSDAFLGHPETSEAAHFLSLGMGEFTWEIIRAK